MWGTSFGSQGSEPTGLRKKGPKDANGTERVFIDLENCEVPNDRTVTRVKVAEPYTSADAERICKFIGSGDLLVVDMSEFGGTADDRQVLTEILHTKARTENYMMVTSGSVLIIAPSDVSFKKI